MRTRQTLAHAIEIANELGFPYAVQEWNTTQGPDYVVAHGSGDGVGKTVYATINMCGFCRGICKGDHYISESSHGY